MTLSVTLRFQTLRLIKPATRASLSRFLHLIVGLVIVYATTVLVVSFGHLQIVLLMFTVLLLLELRTFLTRLRIAQVFLLTL